MTFDPHPHLIQLPKRIKNPETGKWETKEEDYLEVKWRLVWMRDQHPDATIETQLMSHNDNTAVFRAPNTQVGNPNFGRITSQANFARVMQISARLMW